MIKICSKCRGQIEIAGQTEDKRKVFRCCCCGICLIEERKRSK